MVTLTLVCGGAILSLITLLYVFHLHEARWRLCRYRKAKLLPSITSSHIGIPMRCHCNIHDGVIKRKHFFALLAICAGNSPVPGEFHTQRPVTRSFDVFFDLRLNIRLSTHSWGWWFETLLRPLWRHRSVVTWWRLQRIAKFLMWRKNKNVIGPCKLHGRFKKAGR